MWGSAESEGSALKNKKPEDKEESAWVTVARYSEIGFMIPASVIVGYLLGLAADHFLHTHWIYLLGIIFGAVAGFVSMIRRALESSKEEDNEEEKEDGKGGDGSNAG
jgi:F0F1-type ATP synthase assembly protein I